MKNKIFSLMTAMAAGGLLLTYGCGEEPARDFRQVLQEVRVCASGATVDGIDVSYWQGTIDWDAVAGSGVRFAIIRTGDGYFEDPQFERNWAEARRVGLYRGAYHFFRPNKSPEQQADIMVRKLGRLGPGDLPPVIDLENESLYSPYTLAENIDKVRRFMERVEAGTGRQVMIYAGKYFWQDAFHSSDAFVDHPLWIPQYGPTCPDIPSPWTDWLFFQTSSKGSVPGISGNVDLDIFNGSEASLEALANGAAPGGGGGGNNGGGDNGVLQGVVFEDIGQGTADMSQRLPGATVTLSDGQSTVARSGDAYWSFQLPAGTYTVTAALEGYQSASRTCSVNPGGETWCSVGLVAASGGDSGGGDNGGGSGGNSGGDSGGDSSGNSGGDSGGDNGGSNGSNSGGNSGGNVGIDGKGMIYGLVVNAMTVLDPNDLSHAEPVAGAEINVDDQLVVYSDENGYFEAWVEPGDVTLLAKADGFFDSGNQCQVVEGGAVECNIYLPPDTSEQSDEQQQPFQQGCSTAGSPASSSGLLLLGFLLVAARRRRS